MVVKKILFLSVFIFCFSFVFACDSGCTDGASCIDYGATVSHGIGFYYCDYNSGKLIQTKTSGTCENDFECDSSGGYLCLNGECTIKYNNYLDSLKYLNMHLDLTNLDAYCIGSNLFCSNSSSVLNASLSPLNCSFAGANQNCFKCNTGFVWNQTIGRCITGICSSSPGCLNVSSFDNAGISSDYCDGANTCFLCDSDFNWNVTLGVCVLKPCNYNPGCLNQTNLTDAHTLNRACGSGSCFICNAGYAWNSSTSVCDKSAIYSGGWNDISFSSNEFSAGTQKLLGVNDRLKFTNDGLNYWFGVVTVDSSSSRITYTIDPVMTNRYIYVNATQKFDLNDDGYYEASLRLNEIANGKANVSFTKINELYDSEKLADNANSDKSVVTPSSTEQTTSPNEDSNIVPASSDSGTQDNSKLYIIIGVAIFVIILIIVLVTLTSKKKDKMSAGDAGAVQNNRPTGAQPPVQQMPPRPQPSRPQMPRQEPLPSQPMSSPRPPQQQVQQPTQQPIRRSGM